ncbi:hypothetical protein pb186bvf_008901 [Paramecium bursaria]
MICINQAINKNYKICDYDFDDIKIIFTKQDDIYYFSESNFSSYLNQMIYFKNLYCSHIKQIKFIYIK